MVLGELEWHMQKNETRPPTYTIHQNKLKRDIIKVIKKDIGRKISHIPHSNIFDDISPRAREIKEK